MALQARIQDWAWFGTFHEPSSDAEVEGIQLITLSRIDLFVKTPDRAHGVMVLADNPFSRTPGASEALLLAGHSGVVMRAMALLTTKELRCLDEFCELDQRFAVMPEPRDRRHRSVVRPHPAATRSAKTG